MLYMMPQNCQLRHYLLNNQ